MSGEFDHFILGIWRRRCELVVDDCACFSSAETGKALCCMDLLYETAAICFPSGIYLGRIFSVMASISCVFDADGE